MLDMDMVGRMDTAQGSKGKGTNTSACCTRMRPPQSPVPLRFQLQDLSMHPSRRQLLTLRLRRLRLRVVLLRQ